MGGDFCGPAMAQQPTLHLYQREEGWYCPRSTSNIAANLTVCLQIPGTGTFAVEKALKRDSQLQEGVERELRLKDHLSNDNKEVWSDFADSLSAKMHKATVKKM